MTFPLENAEISSFSWKPVERVPFSQNDDVKL